MRKAFITITVLALIASIVGTGVIVYFETNSPVSPNGVSTEIPSVQ